MVVGAAVRYYTVLLLSSPLFLRPGSGGLESGVICSRNPDLDSRTRRGGGPTRKPEEICCGRSATLSFYEYDTQCLRHEVRKWLASSSTLKLRAYLFFRPGSILQHSSLSICGGLPPSAPVSVFLSS